MNKEPRIETVRFPTPRKITDRVSLLSRVYEPPCTSPATGGATDLLRNRQRTAWYEMTAALDRSNSIRHIAPTRGKTVLRQTRITYSDIRTHFVALSLIDPEFCPKDGGKHIMTRDLLFSHNRNSPGCC
jgi:hypothetical protein